MFLFSRLLFLTSALCPARAWCGAIREATLPPCSPRLLPLPGPALPLVCPFSLFLPCPPSQAPVSLALCLPVSVFCLPPRHTLAGAGAHTHVKGTRGLPEGQPDRARGTHRPRGMGYQRARVRDILDGTARHMQRGTRGVGRGKRERHNTRYRPEPPKPAASAAHTQTGHCTRQGSSGAQRHAPTPRLGSIRASPRGSHWRQASSTGPAARAPRATTH